MSRSCTSLAGDPSLGHRSIKILRFCGPPILGPCKDGVLRPVRHAQRIAPLHTKIRILADRGNLGIIRAEPLKSIIILGTPVRKAFQRPELALISSKQCRPAGLAAPTGGSKAQQHHISVAHIRGQW